jgi:predicted outer membrane lipoprotein
VSVKDVTTVIGLAAAFAVLGYLNIQDFHRNQDCEARRGTEECDAERFRALWLQFEELGRKKRGGSETATEGVEVRSRYLQLIHRTTGP